MSKKGEVVINKHKIELTNLDKIFYPKSGYTKEDIINYYYDVAKYMLPHIKNRPMVMQRFPSGIKKEGFYHKEKPDYFPGWIKHKSINLEKDGKQLLVVIEKKEDLIYLANQGTLVFHIWLCQKNNINKPDKIIFDLDPSKGASFEDVKFAAYKLKNIFEENKLNSFVMTTGSKGLHVVIPIKPEHNFDKIRKFSKNITLDLAEKYPDKLTSEVRINKRKGRVFLDYLRNSFGQTGVAPYSLRPIEKAPIATPLSWKELPSVKDAQQYNLGNIFKRLSKKGDPWKSIYNKAKKLKI